MPSKSYPISPAKIGSQDGFRLPKAFSHDHPHLVTAKGHKVILKLSNNIWIWLRSAQFRHNVSIDEIPYHKSTSRPDDRSRTLSQISFTSTSVDWSKARNRSTRSQKLEACALSGDEQSRLCLGWVLMGKFKTT